MASANGRHYREQRQVDDERRYNIHGRNNGLAVTGNGATTGSVANSLSLEELFINGVGMVREGGNGYDHAPSATSTQDIIRLDHPRPDVLRARNEYVDVTRDVASSRRSARQSTGATGHLLTTGHQGDEGLQPAHRAHSMPLSASNTASSPVMAPVLLDGGSRRPWLSSTCTQVNFDRTKITGPSKSAATLANGCHPSTSSTMSKPPLPGRAVRVLSSSSTRNGNVLLPTSSVITSQPRNSSLNSYDKNLTGKRSNDSSANTEIDCRQTNGNFELTDCSSSSLMCKHCGRCRCVACTTPRILPSRWICNDSCLLSSGSVVDTLSCMCCVKGCLYHAGVDSDDFYDERSSQETSDSCTKPSTSSSISTNGSVWSCSPVGSNNCCVRWGILASALACLPCIWCYLPMKACAHGFEALYSRYHDHGCRCDRRDMRGEKRHSGRSPTRILNGGDRSVTRRLRRKRSHTLPPELPSIMAAKAAAAGCVFDRTSTTGCRASSEYS